MSPPPQNPPLPPVAVVVSRYNDWITSALFEGAASEYARRGGDRNRLTRLDAPGSYELPVLARHAAESTRFAAVVCLGCIIRGETTHDAHIAAAVSNALMEIACRTGKPIGFGVLTVENGEQAEARAGGLKGNKGVEAMAAALDTLAEIARLRADPGPTI